MKKKSMITMLVIALMLVLSLTVLSACGKDKDDTPATYSVTVTNGTGGGEYAEGATVKIKANAPETGKEFTIWTLDGVMVDNKTKAEITFKMPANAVTATANYNFIDYTVTVVGGKTDKPKAHYGEEVTITANAPETGEKFTGWTLDGVTVEDNTAAELTFTMPANAVTATANYSDVLYLFALENCTADKESAKFGEEVTFTAAVITGKRFNSWNIKGVDDLTGLDLTKSPLTITMPANDIVVAAQFEQLYKITVLNGCTADKEWAAEGEQVTVNKPANPEGHAINWQTNGITQDWSSRENTVTFTMPANDVQISTYKVLLNYLLTIDGGTATGVRLGEPNTVTDGRNGFDYGTDVTITANEPETGKRFTGWTITGVDTSELVLTNKQLTIKMPANAVTATANY